MVKLTDSAQYLKGVGPRRAEFLARLGIHTVEDVLNFFPRKYVDRGDIRRIADVKPGADLAVCATVVERASPGWGGRLEALIEDDSGTMTVVWFHARYLQRAIEEGQEYVFYGRVGRYRGRPRFLHPKFRRLDDAEMAGAQRILVEYPTTEGLQQASIASIVEQALENCEDEMVELFPEEMRRRLSLPGIADTIRLLHRPANIDSLAPARRRIIFSEFFLMEIAVALRRRKMESSHDAPPIKFTEELHRRILGRFPFSFTAAQTRVIAEIRADLSRDRPMTRLLQGDVGCGKTAVALYAALAVVARGFQVALMAPTEILAKQHYRNVDNYLVDSRVRRSLLVGQMPRRERLRSLDTIRNHEVDIIVGTHALIQEDVIFSRLGLVVVDEQHKFGVMQRAEAKWKTAASPGSALKPHYLVMTATPIPRTLALTVFGDLDLSVIDEMPPGRTPIQTWFVPPEKRDEAYDSIRRLLSRGRQAFVVCPLVAESAKSDLKAATEEAQRLAEGPFADFNVGLLHGKMKSDAKEAAMNDFRSGKTQLLVSTVVIEVGIDIPNATVMVIEHAERFGLSQLHQLRGRIGRGAAKSHCLLFAEPKTEDASRRIQVMTETTDGFRIAEEDLKIRGPGDFFGTRQHGLPELKMANIVEDYDLLRLARQEAFEMIEDDPTLAKPQNKNIRRAVAKQFAETLDLIDVG